LPNETSIFTRGSTTFYWEFVQITAEHRQPWKQIKSLKFTAKKQRYTDLFFYLFFERNVQQGRPPLIDRFVAIPNAYSIPLQQC